MNVSEKKQNGKTPPLVRETDDNATLEDVAEALLRLAKKPVVKSSLLPIGWCDE